MIKNHLKNGYFQNYFYFFRKISVFFNTEIIHLHHLVPIQGPFIRHTSRYIIPKRSNTRKIPTTTANAIRANSSANAQV